MKTSLTKTYFVVWLLLFILGCTASGLIYWRIKVANEVVFENQSIVDSVNQQIARKQGEKSLAEAIKDDEKAIRGAILTKDGIVEFTEFFDTVQGITGATTEIASIVPAGSALPLLDTVTVQLRINGPWANVMHAISLIEALPYAGNVDAITVSTSVPDPSVVAPKVPKKPVWNTTMTYRVLKFKQ